MAHLLIQNEILEDRHLPLAGDRIIVGRDPEAHLRLLDRSISRFHARLEQRDEGAFRVVDLGSSNGTFVNEVRLEGPVTLADGDEIRFGHLRTTFHTDRVEAAPVASEGGLPVKDRPRKAPPGLSPSVAWGGAGLLVVLLCGVGILSLFGSREKDTPAPASAAGDPVKTPPAAANPDRAAPKPAPKPPPLHPKPAPERPPRPSPRGTSEPEPRREPPLASVVLKKGAKIEGFLLDRKDPVYLHVRIPGGAGSRRIPREDVATVDGKPLAVDLKKIYEARLRAAGDTDALIALTRWCATVGLTAERVAVARIIVEGDRDNLEAQAVLGRFRYRGEWSSREDLSGRGCVSADGRLVGTEQDLKEIRRAFLVTLSRSPLAEEIPGALGATRDELVDVLLADPEHWRTWLSELLVRFLGAEEGPAMVAQHEDLVLQLASGEVTVRDVFIAIARSDAVRVRHPDPRDFAVSILTVFVGPGATADESRLASAVKMIEGDRVALFGERGASRDDFLEIVARQPAFYRRQLRYESRRLQNRDLTRRELTRGAMALASDPESFVAIRKGWLTDETNVSSWNVPRLKDEGQFVRSLLGDAFGRVPAKAEEGLLRRVAAEVSHPASLRSLLAILVARSPRLDLSVPPGQKARIWVDTTFRRLLARPPSAKELDDFAKLCEEGEAGRRAVVATLLASPEYHEY